MSQISPPVRILLVAAVAFLAAWMLFLRPSAEPAADPAATEVVTPPPATSPGADTQSAAGDAVQRATERAAATDARAADVLGETVPGTVPRTTAGTVAGAPAREPATAPRPDPKALAALPRDVARAVRQRKVVVLLLWNRKSPEDRAVLRSLRGIDRHGGRVFTEEANVRRVARYAPITRGVNVEQSPSVVVVDRDLKAEALVGFVDTPTIDQAVTNALRDPGPFFRDRYLGKVNHACRIVNDAFLPEPAGRWTRRSAAAWLGSAERVLRRFSREFAAIPAPAKWRRFKAASRRDNAAILSTVASWERLLRSGSRAELRRTSGRDYARFDRSVRNFDRRMEGKRLLGCSRGT